MTSLYKYNELQVRTEIDDEGAIWFAGVDVCFILGYNMPSNVIKKNLDDDERKLTNLTDWSGQQRKGWMISEAGLYSLILSSSKPEAKAFKRWITHEVIPYIRKAGIYSTGSIEYKETISQDLMIDLESTENGIYNCKLEIKRLEKERRKIHAQLWEVLKTSPNKFKSIGAK